MRRVAESDRAAFGQLYDRYAGNLFSIAVRVVRNEKDAEDIVQEVFLQVWQKAASYDSALGQPAHWLTTLARHRSIDRLRTLQRRYELVYELTELEEAAVDFSSGSPRVDLQERTVAIRSALQLLPVDQREAIEFAFFGGLTHEQIAERLQQPLGTIKARIRRGMLKLRDSLEAQL